MARPARFLLAAAVVAGLLVGLAAGQRVALRDLRRLEAVYVAGREATACATQSLLPFAFGDIDLDELDAELERLVVEAGVETDRVRDRLDGRAVVPYPPLRSARRALARALDDQAALYEAMLIEPAGSEDELRALGRSNREVERRLSRVRRTLLVGEPSGWDRRYVCDEPPPAEDD